MANMLPSCPYLLSTTLDEYTIADLVFDCDLEDDQKTSPIVSTSVQQCVRQYDIVRSGMDINGHDEHSRIDDHNDEYFPFHAKRHKTSMWLNPYILHERYINLAMIQPLQVCAQNIPSNH